jgi:hypothetical protein
MRQVFKQKTITFFLSLLAATFILLTGAASGHENIFSLKESDQVVETGVDSRTFFPMVGREVCQIYPTSQFSLQIAALHLIAPLAGNTVLGEDAQLDQTFISLTEALKESGAGWTRLYVSWAQIEPQPPQPGQPPVYHWAWYDGRIRHIVEMGVQPFLTVGVAPDWAADTPCSPIYEARMADFTRFLTDIVNRYKLPPYNVHTWELVNEPDGVSPDSWQGGLGCWGMDGDKYASMLQAAYSTIKAADPHATVLMGGIAYDHFYEYQEEGLCGPECNFNRYFIDDVLQNGGGSFMDALNVHYFPAFADEWERWNIHPATCGNVHDGVGVPYYAGGIDIIAKTNHLRNRALVCYGVSKPVWITELAEHGPEGDSAALHKQAWYVVVGHTRSFAAGVQNVTWYALATYDGEDQGLLFENGEPKPGYYAYQTLTSELTGFRYSETLAVNQGEAYAFRNGCGREKTVGWGAGSLIFAPASSLRVVDLFGQETFIQDGGLGDWDGLVNGQIHVQLNPDPNYFEVR